MAHPEKIEKYFTTQNEYWNKQALSLFKEASKSNLFTDIEIPLHFFSTYENIFYNHRAKPLQVMRQFIGEMQQKKLSNEQQVFIMEHLARYFKDTVYTDDKGKEISLNSVITILETELSKLEPVQIQKADEFDFKKDLQAANKMEDLPERLLFLQKRLKEYKQHNAGNWAVVDWDSTDKKYEAEIQFVQDCLKIEPKQSQNLSDCEGISKIDWQSDERLIPYLIYLLNEAGFLKERNQFAFIEKHFTAKGKPIKRKNLKANYQQADYLNKKLSKTPKEIKQLNEAVEKLKEMQAILDSL